MGFSDFWINKGKSKEQLGETKHGVRKEQVDKKFHNLFDAYDVNRDGTLENEELQGIFKGLKNFAGSDKVLDANENAQVKDIFAQEVNIEDADFQGFVQALSIASKDIVSSSEMPTPDGGKEITTTYSDGTIETISYYPDGDYKFKQTKKLPTTQNKTIVFVDNKPFKGKLDNKIKEEYNKYVSEYKARQKESNLKTPMESKSFSFALVSLSDYKKMFMQQRVRSENFQYQTDSIDILELSERAKQDMGVRDFVLNHYIETHKAAQEALDSMGLLEDTGALINVGAGELWNSIKNVWNGTEEEYQNFYELKDKFEPNYDKALKESSDLDLMREHHENYFRRFESDVPNYTLEKGATFQAKTEQYQNATLLQQRLNILKEAMREVKQYDIDQGLLLHSPGTSEGINPALHIVKANELLLQYFDGDQEAVDMLLEGAMGDNNAKVVQAIKDIYTETEKMNKAVLGDKSFEEIQNEYKAQYKEMYGTDFVPDELTDKVMDAKATGGMVKLAAITIISILITRSPIMAEINGAVAGSAEATGAAANFVRTLVVKYGQTAVRQGIKFAMTTGTVASDAALTLLNQVTDNREGINGQEVWESTKSAAKYIYFGAYIGSPIAEAVGKAVGNIGLAKGLMSGGSATTNGAIQTTTLTGDKVFANILNTGKSIGQKVLVGGSKLGTDIAMFSVLGIVTDGQEVGEAFKEQSTFLPKLKIMNHVLEYVLGRILGGKTGGAAPLMSRPQDARMEEAIKRSGIKDWTIKEMKSPSGVKYTVVDDKGIPLNYNDANRLVTAMMERVAQAYETVKVDTPTPVEKPKTEEASRLLEKLQNGDFDLATNPIAEEITKNLAQIKQEGIEKLEILKNLTSIEMANLKNGLAYDASMYDILILLSNDGKAGGLFAGDKSYLEALSKLKSDKIDVIIDKTPEGNQALVLNKALVKDIISDNKEIFIERLSLDKNASVDEIYSKLIDANGNFAQTFGKGFDGCQEDILGLILGFAKVNTFIFELENYIKNPELRYRNDLTEYKKQLIDALYSDNSPYKNMSEAFKTGLKNKINEITEIKHSYEYIGKTPYQFISFVDEPEEYNRINNQLRIANKKMSKQKAEDWANITDERFMSLDGENLLKKAIEENPDVPQAFIKEVIDMKEPNGTSVCSNIDDLNNYIKSYKQNPEITKLIMNLKNKDGSQYIPTILVDWYTNNKESSLKEILEAIYGEDYHSKAGAEKLQKLIDENPDNLAFVKLLSEYAKEDFGENVPVFTIRELANLVEYVSKNTGAIEQINNIIQNSDDIGDYQIQFLKSRLKYNIQTLQNDIDLINFINEKVVNNPKIRDGIKSKVLFKLFDVREYNTPSDYQFIKDNIDILVQHHSRIEYLTPDNIESAKLIFEYEKQTGKTIEIEKFKDILSRPNHSQLANQLKGLAEEVKSIEKILDEGGRVSVVEAKKLLEKMFRVSYGEEAESAETFEKILEYVSDNGTISKDAIKLIETIKSSTQYGILSETHNVFVNAFGDTKLSDTAIKEMQEFISKYYDKDKSNYSISDMLAVCKNSKGEFDASKISKLMDEGVALKDIEYYYDRCLFNNKVNSNMYNIALDIMLNSTKGTKEAKEILLKGLMQCRYNKDFDLRLEKYKNNIESSLEFIEKVSQNIDITQDPSFIYSLISFLPITKIQLEAYEYMPKEQKTLKANINTLTHVNENNIEVYKSLIKYSDSSSNVWLLDEVKSPDVQALVKDALDKKMFSFTELDGKEKFRVVRAIDFAKYCSEYPDIMKDFVDNNINLSRTDIDGIIAFIKGDKDAGESPLNDVQYEFFKKLLKNPKVTGLDCCSQETREVFVNLPPEAYKLLEILSESESINSVLQRIKSVNQDTPDFWKSDKAKSLCENPEPLEYFSLSDYINNTDKVELLMPHKELLQSAKGTGILSIAVSPHISYEILKESLDVLNGVPESIKNTYKDALAKIFIVEVANKVGLIDPKINGQYLKILYSKADKYGTDFTKAIIDIVFNTAERGTQVNNIEVAGKLYNKNASLEVVRRVLTSDEGIDFAKRQADLEEILKDKDKLLKEINIKCKDTDADFAKREAKALLNNETFTNALLFLPDLSFNAIVNTFYETAKLIHYVDLKPQDYVNGQHSDKVIEGLKDLRQNSGKGKYKELSEDEQIEAYDINNTIQYALRVSDIFYAIASTDIETVKLILDQRINIFKEKMNDLENLNDGDKMVIANLIRYGKRLNKNGQPDKLTGQQKLDIINLVQAIRKIDSNFDFSKYETPLKKGAFILDLEALKKDMISVILKTRGLSDEEIQNVKPENSAWNSKYVGLLTITRGQDHGELSTLVQETSKGKFAEFIDDTSNIYGQANAKTKQEFKAKGLNFEQWEHPDIPDAEFVLSDGRKVKIKVWDRNPLEDIFLGSKTNCCTALDGTNGAATAMFLMNKSFQVVEMCDEQGNVVAMGRVFMAEIDGKAAMMIDCFERNTEFGKNLNLEEFRNAYFSYLNQYVEKVTGDKNAQVYMFAGETHGIPTDDLVNVEKSTDFIGSIHRDDIYINSTLFKWMNPKELKTFRYPGTSSHGIPWAIAPKDVK